MSGDNRRDELARHLYIREPFGPDVKLTGDEENAGMREWDQGLAKPADIADCYTRADQMLRNTEQSVDQATTSGPVDLWWTTQVELENIRRTHDRQQDDAVGQGWAALLENKHDVDDDADGM